MNLKPDSKILIQGITEPLGSIHAVRMKAYGTNVVAGVCPGKGGQRVDDIPVFDLVEQAHSAAGLIHATIIFVPPYQALDAALEAIAAGIRQIILVTGGIPPLDIIRLLREAEATQTFILGPNTPGIIVPKKILLGTFASEFYIPGAVGLISRCGTLTCEVALELTQAGFGQSIGVSIGSDAIVGSSFLQWLQILDKDDATKVIVLVDRIDGNCEETVVPYIHKTIDKPIIAYIAGRYVPGVKPQVHASDFIAFQPVAANVDVVQSKIAAFEQAKITVAEHPTQIPDLVKKALKK